MTQLPHIYSVLYFQANPLSTPNHPNLVSVPEMPMIPFMVLNILLSVWILYLLLVHLEGVHLLFFIILSLNSSLSSHCPC
jgi:hypothetical protein